MFIAQTYPFFGGGRRRHRGWRLRGARCRRRTGSRFWAGGAASGSFAPGSALGSGAAAPGVAPGAV